MTAAAWRPRRPRPEVLAAVLLAHLGLAGLLWRSLADVLREAARPDGPVAVWLHGGATVPDRPAPAAAPRLPAHPPALLPRRSDPIPAAAPAQAATEPVADPAPIRGPGDAVVPPVPAEPAALPLRLTLPRAAVAASAPPQAGAARPAVPWTVESRIAAALGSGPWIEERLGEDQVRFRQGERCVTLKRPRHAGLDPFNASMHATPWISAGVEPCGDGVARTRRP